MSKLIKRLALTLTFVTILAATFALKPTSAAYPVDQRGPRIDMVRQKVTRSPAGQLIEMTLGAPTGSDMWMGMIRPTDVEEMDRQGKTISSTPMLHFCEFGFNYRVIPLDDVNFRHALAHLVPKEKIIGTLFKYIDVKVDTPVPPAQSQWYNPDVDPHPFNPSEAEAILAAAGYHKDGGVWKMPDHSDMPGLRCYIPLEIVAPTSFTIGQYFADECQSIGLTNIQLEPMDFSTYTDKTFDEWDFDIFWVCWDLDRFPSHLWSFFHSENSYLGSYNPYGMYYPALDAQLDIYYKGLDHAAKVVALKTAQELIMGGTTIDPLAIPAQPERSQAIPLIPVYSRNAYDTMDPGLRGMVNGKGDGIDNGWTWMNIHWENDENRPGTNEKIVVPILDEFPEKLNPMQASTVYAWKMLSPTLDGLMEVSPYTLRDIEWLATDWSYGVEDAYPEYSTMWVTFNLRTTDSTGAPIMWQDGDPIEPSDVAFAWDFLHDHEIPRYWDDFKYYLSSEIDGNTITAHMNTTSQWLVYALAGTAYMVPPQVWTPWVGQSTQDILAWDPSAEAGPGGLPTSCMGTGPFILQHSTTFIETSGYGDLTANRDYWKKTGEIVDLLTEMFHSAGDVNRDGDIGFEDIFAISDAFGSEPGDDNWNPDADIVGPAGGPPDGKVDIMDLATCGKYFGETRTVPRGELPPEPVAPTPVISVYPPLVTGLLPGDTFQIAIRISEAVNVYAWEFDLSYAPGVLSVVDVVEGSFLMAGGNTFFAARLDYHGRYRVVCFLREDVAGVYGNGILARVVFTVLDISDSPLHLKTRLRDPDYGRVGHTTEDGYYVGPMADLIPPDLLTKRPKGGGKKQAEWRKTMTKRWGTTEEFRANVTNIGYAPLYTRIKYTSENPHTGDVVTLYSGQEYIPTVTYRTEVLYVNEEIPLFDMWTKYGTSPYLDATGDGSYIEAYDDGMLSNAYGFEDVSLGPYDKIIDVVIEGYTQYPGGADDDMDMDTYCYTPSDYQFAWLGSLYGGSDWSWKTPRWIGDHVSDAVPATTTQAGLNDFSCLFYYWTADGLPHGDMRIDSARLVVTIETGGLYQVGPEWYVVNPGETIELPPAIWHLEKQNTGKWFTTITMEYMYYPPETPYAVRQTGKTTFTYEWWIKGEVE